MADFRLAAQQAIGAILADDRALNAALNAAMNEPDEVPQGDRVYQHVPEQTFPPFTMIADISAESVGGKGGGLDRVTVSLFHAVIKPGREFLSPLMAAARAAIENKTLPDTLGVALSPPVFEGEEDDLMDDGETYAGIQRYSLFAQTA